MPKKIERARVREIKCIGGNWVGGKLASGVKFQAKIYPDPSSYGIEDGRVSKLFVQDVLEYDRGWDSGEEKESYWRPIVAALEKFAQTERFKKELA